MGFSNVKVANKIYATYCGGFTISVEFLAVLYTEGETTYTIEEGERVTKVIVDRIQFTLSEEARSQFEGVHDEWELSICEKYPHDAFVGGSLK